MSLSLSLSSWLKDGQPVRQGERVRIGSGGRRLVISRAQVSDTARFQCIATNEAGEQEREFNVAVHGNAHRYAHCYAHGHTHIPPTTPTLYTS